MKWITYNTVTVTWSSPPNDPMIAGYEVFYETTVHEGTQLEGSLKVMESNEANITNLVGSLKYCFYVVAYSDEDNILPSKRSEPRMLPNSKLYH